MSDEGFMWRGHWIATDPAGYLLDHMQWEEEMVPFLAEQAKVVLTDSHWEVIRFVRDFFETYETSPAIRILVKAMAQSLGPDKGNSRYLHRLFPDGPAKVATKLAGLPKPKKCL